MFTRQRLVVIAATIIATLGLAAPAGADEFGQGNSTSGRVPDNFGHWYCFSGSGWTTAWQTVVNNRMLNLDTQTLYNDALSGTCDSLIDIKFVLDPNLGSGTRGAYRCDRDNNGEDGIPNNADDDCETSTIWLNPTLLTTVHQQRKTACHEIGHSVGLAHYPHSVTGPTWDDCMVSGAVAAGNQWEVYNAHHVAHANSRTPTTS